MPAMPPVLRMRSTRCSPDGGSPAGDEDAAGEGGGDPAVPFPEPSPHAVAAMQAAAAAQARTGIRRNSADEPAMPFGRPAAAPGSAGTKTTGRRLWGPVDVRAAAPR